MMEQLPNTNQSNFYFSKKRNFIYAGSCCLVLCFDDSNFKSFHENSKDLDAVALENYITYQSNVNQYDLISVLESEDINT
jgi:GTPase SAR1 family protein